MHPRRGQAPPGGMRSCPLLGRAIRESREPP
jgi:hypothetical protein